LLVPVPLHRWRLWKRGFNQAALIARALSRRGVGEVLVDGLVRKRATRSLGGLGRAEREAELAGAIVAKDARRKRVVGRTVILVDDVLTSGATLRACVGALVEAGAERVHVACFARVKDGHEIGDSDLDRSANSTTPEAMSAPGAT
jgi:ComF family protein